MVSASVSFPDRLAAERRLLWVRSGHAEVKVQETQIVGILKDAESAVPVADLLRKYGVSRATCRARTFAVTIAAARWRSIAPPPYLATARYVKSYLT